MRTVLTPPDNYLNMTRNAARHGQQTLLRRVPGQTATQRGLASVPQIVDPRLRNSAQVRAKTAAATGVTPPPLTAPQPASATVLSRNRPNMGGTITRGGVTKTYLPSAAQNTDPTRGGSGGTITGRGRTITVPPSGPQALATPAVNLTTPTTVAAPQTESNNPLTGTSNAQPPGTTEPIAAPGAALGVSQRGNSIPRGQDVLPGPANGSSIGGTGAFARKFTSPQSADMYTAYVRRLYGAA